MILDLSVFLKIWNDGSVKKNFNIYGNGKLFIII